METSNINKAICPLLYPASDEVCALPFGIIFPSDAVAMVTAALELASIVSRADYFFRAIHIQVQGISPTFRYRVLARL